MEERQRDMDNIPQIREDRNMDPQDFTRCSICNTPLREAMNSNPE
ncbi:1582_t:CDS:2, partial [Dentiscutata erythropus]